MLPHMFVYVRVGQSEVANRAQLGNKEHERAEKENLREKSTNTEKEKKWEKIHLF